MTVVTSRSDFERLMALRIKEAKLLLDQKDWDGAYYLAGYAVEFALKIRIISGLMKSDSFPDKKLTEIYYKHDLEALRKAAGLADEMDKDAAVSPHWYIVSRWSEQSRYEIGKAEKDATDLYEAIEKGVLPWIKARWSEIRFQRGAGLSSGLPRTATQFRPPSGSKRPRKDSGSCTW